MYFISRFNFSAQETSASSSKLLDLLAGYGDFETENNVDPRTGPGFTLPYAESSDNPFHVTRSTEAAYTGSYSEKINLNLDYQTDHKEVDIATSHYIRNDNISWTYKYGVMKPGENWTYKFHYKTSPSVSHNIKIKIFANYGNVNNGDETGRMDITEFDLAPHTDWQEVAVNFTVPDSAWVTLHVLEYTWIYTPPDSISADTYFDGFSLTNGQYLPSVKQGTVKTNITYPYGLNENLVYLLSHYISIRDDYNDESVIHQALRPDMWVENLIRPYKALQETDKNRVFPEEPVSWNQAESSGWLLKYPDGSWDSDGKWVQYDIGNPSFRDLYINRTLDYVNKDKVKHIFLDGFDADAGCTMGGVNKPAINPRTGAAYTDSQWQADVQTFINQLSSALHGVGVTLTINMAHTTIYSNPGYSWTGKGQAGVDADGFLTELAFTVKFPNQSTTYKNEFYSWAGKILQLQDAAKYNKKEFSNNSGGDETEPRRFAIASFLVSQTGESYFSLTRDWDTITWNSDLEVNIGNPVSNNYVTEAGTPLRENVDDKWLAENSVLLRRDYTSGVVYVNSPYCNDYNGNGQNDDCGAPHTINLSGTYVDLDGNFVNGSATLQPAQGLILVDPVAIVNGTASIGSTAVTQSLVSKIKAGLANGTIKPINKKAATGVASTPVATETSTVEQSSGSTQNPIGGTIDNNTPTNCTGGFWTCTKSFFINLPKNMNDNPLISAIIMLFVLAFLIIYKKWRRPLQEKRELGVRVEPVKTNWFARFQKKFKRKKIPEQLEVKPLTNSGLPPAEDFGRETFINKDLYPTFEEKDDEPGL